MTEITVMMMLVVAVDLMIIHLRWRMISMNMIMTLYRNRT